MRLDEQRIRAKALDLGLVADDGTLTTANRARAAKALTAEQAEQKPAKPSGTLLSRSVVKVSDGHLVIEVTHVPDAQS